EEDPEGGKPNVEDIKIGKNDRIVCARLKNCISALS
ncbi:unnamed protein product, partial [Allacma fusca]